jgi:hypothetical protein
LKAMRVYLDISGTGVLLFWNKEKKNRVEGEESEKKSKHHTKRSKQTNVLKKMNEFYRSMMYQFSKKKKKKKSSAKKNVEQWRMSEWLFDWLVTTTIKKKNEKKEKYSRLL